MTTSWSRILRRHQHESVPVDIEEFAAARERRWRRAMTPRMRPFRGRALATLLCLALTITGLSVAPGGINRPPGMRPVNMLRSEAPEQYRPSLPPGQGVTWTASRALTSRAKRPNEPVHDDSVLRELPSRRGAYTRVFAKADGTLRVQEYLTPIHYRTPEGWKPIDNTVSPDPDMPGWLRTRGNAWSASFGPASLGVRLQTSEGNVRMVPVRSSGAREVPKPGIVSSSKARPRDPKDLAKSGIVRTDGAVSLRCFYAHCSFIVYRKT